MARWDVANPMSRMPLNRRLLMLTLLACILGTALLALKSSPSVQSWRVGWTGNEPSITEAAEPSTPKRPILYDQALHTASQVKTRLRGDVPGYMVFEDIWYHDKVFYFHGDQADMPTVLPDVMHAPISLQHIDGINQMRPDAEQYTRVQGSTIFLNDHPDVNPMLLAWFYHFASEEILGALAALSSADTPLSPSTPTNPSEMDVLDKREGKRGSVSVPGLVIIPWVENWRDPYGLNEALAKGVWQDGVMEPKEWAEVEQQGPIYFERIVIVDRQAAGRAPLSSKWNKMALSVLTQPHPQKFFEPLRKTFLASLGIPIRHNHTSSDHTANSDSLRQPVRVVYVDRQTTNRRLSDESNEAVMRTLRRLEEEGKIIWVYGQFNEMDIRRQVEVTAEADILLGVHGNGLTHQLWMAPGGAVVEIFPAGTFTRDYQVLAEAMGHEHYYLRNNETLPREQWESMVDKQNPGPLYDGTRIELDETFLSTFLDSLVQRYRQ